MPLKITKDQYLKAADIVEKNGLARGVFIEAPLEDWLNNENLKTCPVCTLGAVYVAIDDIDRLKLIDPTEIFVAIYGSKPNYGMSQAHLGVTDWNDRECIDAAHSARTLRAAAELVDKAVFV